MCDIRISVLNKLLYRLQNYLCLFLARRAHVFKSVTFALDNLANESVSRFGMSCCYARHQSLLWFLHKCEVNLMLFAVDLHSELPCLRMCTHSQCFKLSIATHWGIVHKSADEQVECQCVWLDCQLLRIGICPAYVSRSTSKYTKSLWEWARSWRHAKGMCECVLHLSPSRYDIALVVQPRSFPWNGSEPQSCWRHLGSGLCQLCQEREPRWGNQLPLETQICTKTDCLTRNDAYWKCPTRVSSFSVPPPNLWQDCKMEVKCLSSRAFWKSSKMSSYWASLHDKAKTPCKSLHMPTLLYSPSRFTILLVMAHTRGAIETQQWPFLFTAMLTLDQSWP